MKFELILYVEMTCETKKIYPNTRNFLAHALGCNLASVSP